MNEKIWFLKRTDLFEQLTPQERKRLESHAVLRTFHRAQMIYFPTDPGQSVLVLVQGLVKIKTLSVEGKETILAFIEPGELFGEMALLDKKPRNEYAEAVQDSRVIAIPRAVMLELMQARPDIGLHITRLVGLRRRRIENRLSNLLFRSTRERLVAILLELLDAHGQQGPGGRQIRLRLSHQDLANLIGTTRESVTAALGRLQGERLLRVQRRQIIILGRDQMVNELRAVANDESENLRLRPPACPR